VKPATGTPSTGRAVRRGIRSVIAAVAAALALTACGSLPTTGQVQPGLPAGDVATAPEFAFIPAGPQPGASPEEIVDGFIRAGTGAAGGWERAREFLAPSLRDEWDPTASVTVDIGEREFTSPTEGQVSAALVRVATVDENGAYSLDEGTTTELPFRLAQQDDGEWRITEAPDGIVLARNVFPSIFHEYAVMYFDPTWTYLVPDVRWFATNAATRISRALLDGAPSPWLAESVVTAVPDSVHLEPAAVPVSSGVANVGLSSEALDLDAETLSRIQAQLDASLQTANISHADLFVETTPLDPEPAVTRSTSVVAQPLVLTEDGFGFLTGGEIAPLPGLSQLVVETQPAALQVAPDRDFAAARLANGAVARLDAEQGVLVTDTRSGLVDPSADPLGYVWSVPSGAPSAMQVVGVDGAVRPVADAWTGATQVRAMSVSRDGTRVAAAVSAGGSSEVWVAGVVRDAQGVPVRLGEHERIASLPGQALSLSWLDDSTVGVLASGMGGGVSLFEVVVGGTMTTTDAPTTASSVSGVNSPAAVRLRTDDGLVYVRRGSSWAQTTQGVLVLATQQGRPR